MQTFGIFIRDIHEAMRRRIAVYSLLSVAGVPPTMQELYGWPGVDHSASDKGRIGKLMAGTVRAHSARL